MQHFKSISSLRNFRFSNYYSTTTATATTISENKNGNVSQIRSEIAPWIKIGDYQPGLLTHLKSREILRALFVLRMCSFDSIVSRSLQLFDISTKFGGNFLLRHTFFNQFVGGETVERMSQVVGKMQERGLVLMVAPVLEEDVEDAVASRKTYDENLETLKNLAEMTSKLEKKKPIIQLKPTAIMPASTLEKVSRSLLTQFGKDPSAPASLVYKIANAIDNDNKDPLHFDNVGKEETSQFLDGLRRADEFVKYARDLNVHVLVDAEFYACKPAISTLALALMTRHNRDYHIVGNTIQGYLKEAVPTITKELETITNEIGVNWYGKIVRGAYMDRERVLAKKNGYPSPICDNYDATNESYNRAVDRVLTHISSSSKKNKSHLLVATHNEVSIRQAAKVMKERKISAEDDSVSFGQIYGMADYLSTPLVNKGYHVYKSTPYGPLLKVLPYLARRASENRSVMEGAREERVMLWKELKARMRLIS